MEALINHIFGNSIFTIIIVIKSFCARFLYTFVKTLTALHL